jgi:hypothetical protein
MDLLSRRDLIKPHIAELRQQSRRGTGSPPGPRAADKTTQVQGPPPEGASPGPPGAGGTRPPQPVRI